VKKIYFLDILIFRTLDEQCITDVNGPDKFKYCASGKYYAPYQVKISSNNVPRGKYYAPYQVKIVQIMCIGKILCTTPGRNKFKYSASGKYYAPYQVKLSSSILCFGKILCPIPGKNKFKYCASGKYYAPYMQVKISSNTVPRESIMHHTRKKICSIRIEIVMVVSYPGRKGNNWFGFYVVHFSFDVAIESGACYVLINKPNVDEPDNFSSR
jgi:hypothetical protein